jgi:hypothetical protein
MFGFFKGSWEKFATELADRYMIGIGSGLPPKQALLPAVSYAVTKIPELSELSDSYGSQAETYLYMVMGKDFSDLPSDPRAAAEVVRRCISVLVSQKHPECSGMAYALNFSEIGNENRPDRKLDRLLEDKIN